MTKLADFTLPLISGAPQALAAYAGKVVLIVNTASKCGYTGQYAGLEALWQQFGPRGLVVLGFPCDQFGGQEPGSSAEIESFCTVNFGVTFPLFAKLEVNGPGEAPLFSWLKSAAPGVLGSRAIKWNFTKFLVGRDGQAVQRFAPETEPEAIAPAIEAML